MTSRSFRPHAAAAAPALADTSDQYMVTTFRIRRTHRLGLHEAALERMMERGGKADASEVLREILDEWMARNSGSAHVKSGHPRSHRRPPARNRRRAKKRRG